MTGSQRLAVLVLGAMTPLLPWTASAAGQPAGSPLVKTSFHLQAAADLPRATTFWVAYGPLGGKFGLIRLRSAGNGRFVGAGRFPSGARAYFSYIEGHGTMRTREGIVPGNPVHTIGHAGPLIVGRQSVPLVRLPTPAG